MDYQFHKNSKFALLAFSSVFADLPTEAFQLSDDKTWIMPRVPVPDLGIWEKWLGSIRLEHLGRANLVLLVEEPSDIPGVLDDVHQRLSADLCLLFYILHLRVGVEISENDGADLLRGSSKNGRPEIRQVSKMPRFYRSQGSARAPITRDWLEDSLVLRDGWAAMKADKTQFKRVTRGLITLFKGLKEKTGQDRLHQYVRSLEALILPVIGRTKKHFVGRCQTFAAAADDTHELLSEAFDMRSATEHLNPWDEAVQCYPLGKRDAVCWQRTRQIERLACDAYSRLLSNSELREDFRTEAAIETFWKSLSDEQRLQLWGTPLDIAQEPQYDQ